MAETDLSRRAMIRGGTAVALAMAAPVAAGAAAGADAEILAIEPKIVDAARRLSDAVGAESRADEAMIAWKRRNPAPKMRECWVGTNAEYEHWFRLHCEADDPATVAHLDPNRDLKAAMAEHSASVKVWKKREAAAIADCRQEEASERTGELGQELTYFIEQLCDMRATTMAGLMVKARLAHDDHDIAQSIVDDLLAMQGANA